MSIPDTSIIAQMVKNLPAVRENQVQSLGLKDTLEKGILPFSSGYYALQYSCLDNSKDKGAWWAIVHAVTVGNGWATNTCKVVAERKDARILGLQGRIQSGA